MSTIACNGEWESHLVPSACTAFGALLRYSLSTFVVAHGRNHMVHFARSILAVVKSIECVSRTLWNATAMSEEWQRSTSRWSGNGNIFYDETHNHRPHNIEYQFGVMCVMRVMIETRARRLLCHLKFWNAKCNTRNQYRGQFCHSHANRAHWTAHTHTHTRHNHF